MSVASYQALPPPYQPGHVLLKSASTLRSFEHALKAYHIGITPHPTSSPGCTGGIEYTVIVTYRSGQRKQMDAYDCGGSISGNMTGHVEAFLGYLDSLLS